MPEKLRLYALLDIRYSQPRLVVTQSKNLIYPVHAEKPEVLVSTRRKDTTAFYDLDEVVRVERLDPETKIIQEKLDPELLLYSVFYKWSIFDGPYKRIERLGRADNLMKAMISQGEQIRAKISRLQYQSLLDRIRGV